ncbi:MAG TPA: hypothetical protein VMW16_01765 [Sedimentisphaerales bacterium]|nr:hypothetical protein [Sedimentisphaerales bacterium]
MKSAKAFAIIVMGFGLTVCAVRTGHAAPMGKAFTYQGRLIDANLAADDLYDFRFRLYDASVGGKKIGPDVNESDVDVIEGYFTVTLDFASDPNAFNGNARWLEIGVRPGWLNDPNEYTALWPRQELTPTPYATYAANVGLMSVDGVSNPGGNVDLLSQNAIAIAPNNTAKTITIGESHSPRKDNPHNVTSAQTGALASVDGVSNPGGNVDFVAGANILITPDVQSKAITFTGGAAIKQVIRGTATYNSFQTSQTVAFSPSIDPSKSVAFVPSFAILTSTTGGQAAAIMTNLTSDTITIEISVHNGSFKVSFQIVEYY